MVVGETDPTWSSPCSRPRPGRSGAAAFWRRGGSSSTATSNRAGRRRPAGRRCGHRAAPTKSVLVPLHGAHQGDNAAVRRRRRRGVLRRRPRRGRGRRGVRRGPGPRAPRGARAPATGRASTGRTTPLAPPRWPGRWSRTSRGAPGRRWRSSGCLNGRSTRRRCSPPIGAGRIAHVIACMPPTRRGRIPAAEVAAAAASLGLPSSVADSLPEARSAPHAPSWSTRTTSVLAVPTAVALPRRRRR